MATETHDLSDLAIPPGEYLLEATEELGLNQADLARRMGRYRPSVRSSRVSRRSHPIPRPSLKKCSAYPHTSGPDLKLITNLSVIPRRAYDVFIAQGQYTDSSIREFAELIDIVKKKGSAL